MPNTPTDISGLIQRFLDLPLFSMGGVKVTVGLVAAILFLVFGVRWIINRTSAAVHRRLVARGHPESTVYPLIRLSRVIAWSLAVMVLLDTVGVGITGLFTVLAALGVGLGFGLQNLFKNALSGLILLIERPIRVSDTVELRDQQHLARVTEIGWRATRVVTQDNIEVLIPNSSFLEQDLINWTLSDPLTRLDFQFSVAYDTPVGRLKELALGVARENPLVRNDPAPQLLLTDFGDSGLVFTLRYWVDEPWRRKDIASELRYKLLEALRLADIEIPYPQRDVHVRTGPNPFHSVAP